MKVRENKIVTEIKTKEANVKKVRETKVSVTRGIKTKEMTLSGTKTKEVVSKIKIKEISRIGNNRFSA